LSADPSVEPPSSGNATADAGSNERRFSSVSAISEEARRVKVTSGPTILAVGLTGDDRSPAV
jgi:hypothetical protein